jgi:uncharacterized membrane protein HdeD (DUF308 family)
MKTIDSTAQATDTTITESGAIKRRWWGLLLLGIVQVIGGVFAIAVPVAASLAAALVFGAVLLVLGVLQAVHAISVRKSKKVVLLQLLGGLLYVATGALVLWFPVSGAISLTILVGAMLIADGVIRCALAYRFKPVKGWGWFLCAGVASAAVGILLLIGWPLTGLWALGLLLGINLLFIGMTNSALAVAFRTSVARESRRASGDDLRDLPA